MAIHYEDFKTLLPNAHEYENYLLTECVFHDDNHPSLLIFKDGWWRCLGCNRVGGWNLLWNKLRGQPIIIHPEHKTSWRGPDTAGFETLEQLTYQAHLDLMQFSSFQWYLEQRGLLGRIEINELGYHEGWYTIPVTDKNGEFVTTVFRAAPHVQKVTGERYWAHHAPVPYVPDWNLFAKSKVVFVVYGMLDALTLAELRLPVMTSTAGQGKFNPEWLAEYRKPIVILPDEGEEKSAIELQKALGWRGFTHQLDYPYGKKDPNGFFEAHRNDDLYKQLLNDI